MLADLYDAVAAAGASEKVFVLLCGFPPRTLSLKGDEATLTVHEAGLLMARVIQHPE